MKKLVPFIAAFFFAVFVLGIFAAMMFYSWQGLANIFPDDLLGQGFGMLNFDVAALVWFSAMVYRSRSIGQYVVSFIGFMVGLVGTLGLIGIEVGLSSGMLVRADMVKPLTYIFIGVLVGHVVLIYAHHASAPEMAADISLGVEKAKITGRAEEAATRYLTDNIEGLSQPIAAELIKRVKDDLNLRPAGGVVLDLPALNVDPVADASSEPKVNPLTWAFWKSFVNKPNGARTYEQSAQANLTRCPRCGGLLLADGHCMTCERKTADMPAPIQKPIEGNGLMSAPVSETPPSPTYHPVGYEPMPKEQGETPAPFPNEEPSE